MKRNDIKRTRDPASRNIGLLVCCVLAVTAASVLLSVFLKVNTVAPYRRWYLTVKPGQIAEENVYVKTPAEVIDTGATAALTESNRRAVLPVFSFSVGTGVEILSEFDRFRRSVKDGSISVDGSINGDYETSADGTYAPEVEEELNRMFSVSYELLTEICRSGYFSQAELEEIENAGYTELTLSGGYTGTRSGELVLSVLGNILTESTIQNYIDMRLREYNSVLRASSMYLVQDILNRFLRPNVYYDAMLTEERRNTAAENTPPVVISFSRGDLLLQKDHVITREQIDRLYMLSSQTKITFAEIASDILLGLICFSFVFFIFMYIADAMPLHSRQFLLILTAGTVLTCALAYLSAAVSINIGITWLDAVIPVSFLPLLMTMLTNRREMGILASFVVSISLMFIPGSTVTTFFYYIVSGITCTFLVRFFNKRLDMIIQWLLSLAVRGVITTVFLFINSYGFAELPVSLASVGVSVTLAHIMLSVAMPLLERFLNLPTTFRLHELAYSDSPLLKRLAQSAPGTYNHCRQVSELAAEAAEAVGANSMIARVGALYHDIGKTDHPEYFVENQSGTNKHDDINPSLSASIIKNHVKSGADKAREAGLPAEIVNIIANHHGNDVIAYFYNEARKEVNPHEEHVHAEDYSYNAEIPDSKECAIVMLADGVEAAARTVQDPTPAKFAKLIRQIVLKNIEHGQLDNSKLTMNDITVISDSFLKTLTAQYHSRIQYPDEED